MKMNLKWAVIAIIDRKTQDDNRSKVSVEALFQNPEQAEDCYIPCNADVVRRYIVHVDKIEEFENVYNAFQDLREKYGKYAIFHIKDLGLGCDTERKYREILGIYTDIEF